MRSASLAIFLLDLRLGEILLWGRLEPALGGTGVGGYRLDSPAEGASAVALVHFN